MHDDDFKDLINPDTGDVVEVRVKRAARAQGRMW